MKLVRPTLSRRDWCRVDHRTRSDDVTRAEAVRQSFQEPEERGHWPTRSGGCQAAMHQRSIAHELAVAGRQRNCLLRIDLLAPPDGRSGVQPSLGDGLCGANSTPRSDIRRLKACGHTIDGGGISRWFRSWGKVGLQSDHDLGFDPGLDEAISRDLTGD